MDNSQPPIANPPANIPADQPIPPQANLPPPSNPPITKSPENEALRVYTRKTPDHSSQPLQTGSPAKQDKKKYLLPVSIVFLVISTFLISFYYFANQRQPKTNTRAANPTPNQQLPTKSLLPPEALAKGGSFSTLISSPPISPISSSDPSPAADNPQSTNNNQPPAVTLPADQRPSRVILDITATGNSFTPNQFEAFNNQIIVLNVFAADKDYDISIDEFGVKKVFKQGIRSSMEFQATGFGQYTFICKDNCSGADTARGLLTIKP